MMIGKIAPFSRGEAERTCPYQLQPRPMGRAWEYWTEAAEEERGVAAPAAERRESEPGDQAPCGHVSCRQIACR